MQWKHSHPPHSYFLYKIRTDLDCFLRTSELLLLLLPSRVESVLSILRFQLEAVRIQ